MNKLARVLGFGLATFVAQSAFAQSAVPPAQTQPASSGSAAPTAPNPPQTPSQADILFNEARELMDRNQYKEACAKFEASQKLDPAPGTLFNLAKCEEGRSRFGTASQHWRAAIKMLPATDPRSIEATQYALAAELKAGRLMARAAATSPAGMMVQWNGTPFLAAQTDVVLIVDAGVHTFVVTAPGHEPRTITVTVPAPPEGTTTPARPIEVELMPGPAKPVVPIANNLPPPIATIAPNPILPPEPSWPSQHKVSLGITAGGLGVIGIGAIVASTVTSIFHDIAIDCNENRPGQCTGKDFDPARDRASIGNAIIVGGAAVMLGGVIVFVAAEKGLSSKPKTQASLAVYPNGAAISLSY